MESTKDASSVKPFKKFVTTGHQKDFTYNRIPNFSREVASPYLRGLFKCHLVSSTNMMSRKSHDSSFASLGEGYSRLGDVAH
jgi:hypothetical protein